LPSRVNSRKKSDGGLKGFLAVGEKQTFAVGLTISSDGGTWSLRKMGKRKSGTKSHFFLLGGQSFKNGGKGGRTKKKAL